MKALILLLFFATAAHAEVTTFESGIEQVTLVELYSSQGCSSCPPAQRWVNQFKDDPQLWKKVISVVSHVDYWGK